MLFIYISGTLIVFKTMYQHIHMRVICETRVIIAAQINEYCGMSNIFQTILTQATNKLIHNKIPCLSLAMSI